MKSEKPVLQTILNVSDGLYGIRYLKIVKSQMGPHYVVDVMFTMGLRLTTDILPGDPSKNIIEDLDHKLQMFRPSGYDEIMPAIEFISECASRALSDEMGRIAAKQLHEETMKEAWNLTLFRRWLKTVDRECRIEYERAIEIVEDSFKDQESSRMAQTGNLPE